MEMVLIRFNFGDRAFHLHAQDAAFPMECRSHPHA